MFILMAQHFRVQKMLVMDPSCSKHPDKTCEVLFDICRTNQSIYVAEAKAIKTIQYTTSLNISQKEQMQRRTKLFFSDVKFVLKIQQCNN